MPAAPAPISSPPRSWRGPWPLVGLWVVLLEIWFRGPLLGVRLPLWTAAVAAVALAAFAFQDVRRVPIGFDRGLVGCWVGVMALATLVRAPALAAPAGLISSDSAVAGLIAQDLRAGRLPAPVYPPGFPYEGTLKPHLTAALGLATGLGTPFVYALASHVFYLLWIGAVLVLARRAAGPVAAAAAGVFMAVSPRFLAAFSLNNVGQYPEVNALGALALALLGSGAGLLAVGFVLGLALWQQLLAVYFVLAAGVAVLLTPAVRRPAEILRGLVGFLAGSYPLWIWNASNGWAGFDFFRRGSKNPWDRLAGLPDRIEKTVSLSFPKLFGLTDVDAPPLLAALVGLVLPALVVAFAWARREEIRSERGRSVAALVALLAVVVLGVFAVSKFSHRGAQRPRYLLPLYTSVSVAAGWAFVALGRRSRPASALAGAGLLALNAAGLVPWLRSRAPADARDHAIVEGLAQLGVKTGYTGFWIASKYTFLSEGRLTLSGELGPDVSWVHPGSAERVRREGPDAYVLGDPNLGTLLSRRLDALGAKHERTEVGPLTVFHGLSRRVRLEEVSGYDDGGALTAQPPREGGEEDD